VAWGIFTAQTFCAVMVTVFVFLKTRERKNERKQKLTELDLLPE